MNRDGHTAISFFVGTEVEHTPALGQTTLFVVGVHDSTEIMSQAQRNSCTHIYFGANQSFPRLEIYDGDGWRPWERMIKDCLDSRWLCTLDLDVSCAEGLLESSLVDYNNFIPMISVKLPYIRQFGYNATLKIDDRDFEETNAGVWCHSLHKLQNRSVFTPWSKYSQDKVLK
jgi:hypothetical protein